jgi:hypothetical protein
VTTSAVGAVPGPAAVVVASGAVLPSWTVPPVPASSPVPSPVPPPSVLPSCDRSPSGSSPAAVAPLRSPSEPASQGVPSTVLTQRPSSSVAQAVGPSDSSACAAWPVRIPPARAAPTANAPTEAARAARPGSGSPARSR